MHRDSAVTPVAERPRAATAAPGYAPRSERVVVITDGEQRAALAVVRSLGRAGWQCAVTAVSGGSLAGSSRYCAEELVLPDPARYPDDYAAALVRHANALGARLLIPVTEASVFAVLKYRDDITAAVPFPEASAVRAICNKQHLLNTARELGIRVPRQREIRSKADAAGIAFEGPAVIKPHRSVVETQDGSRIKLTVKRARTADELRSGLAGLPESAFPVLLQEMIQGPGVGHFVLLHEGEIWARFAHRRLREKPPWGGVSVLRQSEPIDGTLFAKSVALLRRYDWDGVAMIEYKIDQATGEAVLMEVNGRFWGSLQLAIDAGVDFPALLASLTIGERPDKVLSYRSVCSRWFWGDIDHVIAVFRSRDHSAADRLFAVSRMLGGFGIGSREEVFRWSDPLPFLRETSSWLRAVVAR